MIELKLDWDKAHPLTTHIDITPEGDVVEKKTGDVALRKHYASTFFFTSNQKRVNNPNKQPAEAPRPPGYPPGYPQPAGVPAPQLPKADVKLNGSEFAGLLAELKAQGQGTTRNKALTLMEVHEKLLAMKVLD